MSNNFAHVAIPLAVRKTLLYSIPEWLRGRVNLGVRVLVPLGKRKIVPGYVVEQTDRSPVPSELVKDLIDVLDREPLLNRNILELTQWVANYYFVPWGLVIKAALPSGINYTSLTHAAITEAGAKLQDRYFATHTDRIAAKFHVLRALAQEEYASVKDLTRLVGRKSIHAILNELEKDGLITITQTVKEPRIKQKEQLVVRLADQTPVNGKLNEKQRLVLEGLRAGNGPILLSDLQKTTNCNPGVIKTLARKGWVTISKQVVFRSPYIGKESIATKKVYELTKDQQAVFDEILTAIAKEDHAAFLIHGVTGSGKTEIYMRAIYEVIKRGASAMMLVPEISLTPAVGQLFRASFGDCVAILHSGLSAGERLDEWWRIKLGLATVVVGTRSAVFAPLKNLKLIIVDEEHDGSYKQEETPRYNGRDTARKRAALEKAVLILGSATPALETYYEAKEKHTLKPLTLESRILDRPLPEVNVIDMREEFSRFGKSVVISSKLKDSIQARLERKQQVLILLNRRGYSHLVLCRSCGATIHCDLCSIAMTFHQKENLLICHYCGGTKPVPESCATCGRQFMYFLGEGTEKIEEILKQFFPRADIDRMDRDTTKRKESYYDILANLAQGKTDLLIGTQMIAKGHDFPNVTLVGVVSAESGLNFPDFRSAERTFQLLTQVAGRAGRGEVAGDVILQTYYPNHYSIKFARQQNYQDFYAQEIRFRELMHYPPFVVLANILVKDKDLRKTKQTAAKLAQQLEHIRDQFPEGRTVKILGPAPAPLEKIKGQYRYQILIKARNRAALFEILDRSYSHLLKARAGMKNVTIDIDPLNIL